MNIWLRFSFDKPLISFSTGFCFILASSYVFCERKVILHAVRPSVFKTQIMIQCGDLKLFSKLIIIGFGCSPLTPENISLT